MLEEETEELPPADEDGGDDALPSDYDILRLCREFWGDAAGTDCSHLEAGRQLHALSSTTAGCEVLASLALCWQVCEAVVHRHARDPIRDMLRLAMDIIANMSEGRYVEADITPLLDWLCEGQDVADSSVLSALFKYIINACECSVDSEDRSPGWLKGCMPPLAYIVTMAMLHSADPSLLASAWSCAYTLLSCDNVSLSSLFADNWSAVPCIYNSIDADNYVDMIQSDPFVDTAFKWMLAVVDILAYRSSSLPTLRAAWSTPRAEGPNARDVVARLLELSLDSCWGMTILCRNDDQVRSTLPEQDMFLLSCVLGRVLSSVGPSQHCNSDIISLFIASNLMSLILKHLRVLEEALLRQEPDNIRGVMVLVTSLLDLINQGAETTPHADIVLKFCRPSSPLHSIIYLFQATNLVEKLHIQCSSRRMKLWPSHFFRAISVTLQSLNVNDVPPKKMMKISKKLPSILCSIDTILYTLSSCRADTSFLL